MGSKEHFEGIIPRPSSILIDFRWNGNRFRERVKLRPTEANLRAVTRMRTEIVQLIDLERFTWDDFARYFPDSPRRVRHEVPTGDPTFADMADRWLALARPKVAATTWDEYKNLLNNYWRPLFGARVMRSITYEELVLGIAQLPPLAAKTFNNAMTPLRGIWAMAAKMGKVDTNLTLEIESRKGQRSPPDPLEVSEVMLILEHLRGHCHPNWWNYFTVAFLWGTSFGTDCVEMDPRRRATRTDAYRQCESQAYRQSD